MRELGYSVGRNLVIEYRWAGNDEDHRSSHADRLPALRTGNDKALNVFGTNRGEGRPVVGAERAWAEVWWSHGSILPTDFGHR